MLIQAAKIAQQAVDLLTSRHEAERMLGLRCLHAVTKAGVGLPVNMLAALERMTPEAASDEGRLHAEIMLGQMAPVTAIRTIKPTTPLRQNDPPVPFLDTASLLAIDFVKAASGAEGFHRYAITDDMRLVAECEGGYRGFVIGKLSTQAGLNLPAMNPECDLDGEDD